MLGFIVTVSSVNIVFYGGNCFFLEETFYLESLLYGSVEEVWENLELVLHINGHLI